jgi:hypothetical protein
MIQNVLHRARGRADMLQEVPQHGRVSQVGPVVPQAVCITAALSRINGDILSHHVVESSCDGGANVLTAEIMLGGCIFQHIPHRGRVRLNQGGKEREDIMQQG